MAIKSPKPGGKSLTMTKRSQSRLQKPPAGTGGKVALAGAAGVPGREPPGTAPAGRPHRRGEPAAPDSPSVLIVDGHRAANFSEYTPALIGMIYNRLSASASGLYRSRFGVGISEWRVVGLLAAQPGLAAWRVSEITGMDKAAVSRAVASLDAAGLLDHDVLETDGRRKTWRLSARGHRLHEQILDLALAREKILMSGISRREIEKFNAIARRMLANLPLLEESQTRKDAARRNAAAAKKKRGRKQ